MASKIIDIDDDDKEQTGTRSSNSALQRRQPRRKRNTEASHSLNSEENAAIEESAADLTMARPNSALRRKSSVPFQSTEKQLRLGARQRSLSAAFDIPPSIMQSNDFVPKRLSISRRAVGTSISSFSSTEIQGIQQSQRTRSSAIVDIVCNNDDISESQAQTTASTTEQRFVDISVHVVHGSIGSINQRIMNKKIMNMKKKPMAMISDKPHQNDDSLEGVTKESAQAGLFTKPLKQAIVKAIKYEPKIKSKESKGKTRTSKVTSNRKKSIKKRVIQEKHSKQVISTSVETENVQKVPNLAQTNNEIVEPCPSITMNKKCANELVCPYLHSMFPCKFYYLGLSCPNGDHCLLLHNGPLPEKLTEALRTHILKLLSNSSSYSLSKSECYFLEQVRIKDDLGQCLLNVQTRLSGVSPPKKARMSCDESSSATELSGQSELLPQKQNISATEISEVIEIDDDDEHILIIDENSNDPNVNSSSTLSEDCTSDLQLENIRKIQALEIEKKVEECYQTLKEANCVNDWVLTELNALKSNANYSMKERATKLMALYETLSQIEKQIKEKSLRRTLNELDSLESNETIIIERLSDSVGSATTSEDKSEEILNTNLITNNEDIVSEEILAPDEHLKFNVDDVDADGVIADINVADGVTADDVVVADIVANDVVTDEVLEDDIAAKSVSILSVENLPYAPKIVSGTEISQPDVQIEHESVAESLEKLTQNEADEPTDNEAVEHHQNGVESQPLQIELSPEEKKTIDELSLTRMDENEMSDEVSPPYEKLTVSIDVTPKSSHKRLKKSDEKKEKPNLRSDNLQQSENVVFNSTKSLDTDKPKIFKSRRLRIPKVNSTAVDANDGDSKNSNQMKSLQTTNQQSLTGKSAQPKVILSNRYFKRFKNKSSEPSATNKVAAAPALSHISSDAITKDSVESLMSALYGDHEDTADNNHEQSDSESSQKIVPISQNGSQKAISLRRTPLNRLKTRNITITESTIRRRVAFETPATAAVTSTSTLSSSSLSSEGIISKCKRGKPYVALAKLKPEYLKLIKNFKRGEDKSTTSITSCDITETNHNDGHSSTSLKETSCLCDDTFHILGQNSEERDYECNMQTHTIMTIDSMDILDKNSMECENEKPKTTRHITYEKNVVFEDISTTDYYSSSDEKVSEPNASLLLSPVIVLKSPTSNHKKMPKKTENSIYQGQPKDKQQTFESDLQSQSENENNKSKFQSLQLQHAKKTKPETTNLKDLEHQAVQIEGNKLASVCYVDIKKENDEPEAKQQRQVLHKENDENQNENSYKQVIEPPTPPRTNNKSSFEESSAINVVKRKINFENTDTITPIASPTSTYSVCDGIASPSPVRGEGGFLVPVTHYLFDGEIDGRLTMLPMRYKLFRIDLTGLEVNIPNKIDLKKVSREDPRIFRTQRVIKTRPQESTSPYQNLTTPAAAAYDNYSSSVAAQYDPRSRQQPITYASPLPSPQPTAQNAMVFYNTNANVPMPMMHHHNLMPTTMNMISTAPTFATYPHQAFPMQEQMPSKILYAYFTKSKWYNSLPSSQKMQVNNTATKLVSALNNFQRERHLNPTALFDIFKIDSALEIINVCHGLEIEIDVYGIIQPKTNYHQPVPTPDTGGHNCRANVGCSHLTSMPMTGSCSCHTPTPFTSCHVEHAPKLPAPCCCSHKQSEAQRPNQMEQSSSSRENHHGNENPFSKPHNERQTDRSYDNQRYKNGNNNNDNGNGNPRFSKPSSYSYGAGGGSPNRSSSPTSQPFSPRKGGFRGGRDGGRGGRGGGRGGRGRGGGNYNNRYQNNNENGSSSWSEGGNNPRFNKNNNYNSNSNYGNNNSSPSRPVSPNKSSSPPPPPPPLSSPKANREQSPVLNSPARQQKKQAASTDEECWD